LTFVTPIVLPLIGTALKTVAKTGIKGGMMAYDKGRELVDGTQKSLVRITKEARSEADAALKAMHK
jgi:hypothetical protein